MALARTGGSEERIDSMIRLKRISEVRKALTVTSKSVEPHGVTTKETAFFRMWLKS
jgi:hypothetical protein